MVKLTYFRYISERSFSLQVETAYLMDCNISDMFKTKSTATLERKILPSLNDTFELWTIINDRGDLKCRVDQNDILGSHWKIVELVTTLNVQWIVSILCRTLAVTTYHYPHLCQCQFQHRLMSTSTLRLSTLTIVTSLPS